MKRGLLITGIALGTATGVAIVGSTLTGAGIASPTATRPLEAPVVAALPATSRNAVAKAADMPTPETARLEQRRVLYESVDALLQVAEFQRARRLLDADRARNGNDAKPWRDLGQGYRLLADCLEHPSAHYQGRAEAFLLASEARALDAKLRAACVEPRH